MSGSTHDVATVTIRDGSGVREYRVVGRVAHYADTLTTYTMFGLDQTERRRLHTLQFVSGD